MKDAILSSRMNHIDTSLIRKMFDLAGDLKNPINLSIGQPHFPAPRNIVDAAAKALTEGRTAYTQTQGIPQLREAMAAYFREKNGIATQADRVLISSGVSSLLQLLFMATIDPGDRVLLVSPAFLIYRGLVSFFRAEETLLPQTFAADDLKKIPKDRLKLIIYSSPSNPTGYIMKAEQIKALADLAEETGALLVSDEIYALFDYDKKFISAGSIYPETLTLFGFSKSYSMTGLRLSAATGPQTIMKAMTTLQQYTVVCAPSAVQWAGVQALKTDMTPYVDDYRKKRDLIRAGLQGVTEFYEPEGAFYLFAKVPGEDMAFCERAIKEKELLVVPGRIFTNETNWIRISYAAEESVLHRGIDALKELMK